MRYKCKICGQEYASQADSMVCCSALKIATMENSGGFVVLLEISREEIESLNISHSLACLYKLSDTKEAVMQFRESLLYVIYGYDDDPRELEEIPEVMVFMKRLTQEWPFWVWFMRREKGIFGQIFLLLRDRSNMVKKEHGKIRTRLPTDEFIVIFQDLMGRSAPLFQAYQISVELVEHSVNSAFACLDC